MKKSYLLFLGLIAILAFIEYSLQNRLTWDKEYKRFGSAAEAKRHYYPIPHTGAWAAIYTENFAKEFNLSLDNVSDNLDGLIEYVEIVSVRTRELKKPSVTDDRFPKRDCIINILTSKSHDIPLHERRTSIKGITKEQRIENQLHTIRYGMVQLDKPIQALDVDKHDASYRRLSVLNAIHSHDMLLGYDYFSTYIYRCRKVLESVRHKKDITFQRFMRDSVIKERSKKQVNRYTRNEERIVTYKPHEKSLFIQIAVPQILSARFYEGTEVPIEPTHALIDSVLDVPKVIAVLPFALLMGLGAPDVSEAKKAPVRMGFPAQWPEDMPTHFKLEKNDHTQN